MDISPPKSQSAIHLIVPTCLGLLAFADAASAGAPARNENAPEFADAQIEFFEERIRPLLADNCLECHTGVDAKLGLELDHREGWLSGSDYRQVIDRDRPAQSLVIKAVSHSGGKEVPAMPEKGGKIDDESIAALTQWIGMGLPWPNYDQPAEGEKDPLEHWSFQPVDPPELPDDAGHPIDHFIRKAQREAGVKPAPRADRRTLYRRASFDLLGLPPKYEEMQAFLDDSRPHDEAWADVVDRFLDSPRYGERWARHWMDVARYSDTKGYEAGGRERRFVYSFTYRDWLIRSLNEDMPYDRFLLYQLAAEQLVDWNGPEKKHLAALGFLSLSKNGRQELVLDDRIDTTFRGTMALTVSCARCHDHKFDPISTQEYYGLYGVFRNSMNAAQPTIGEPDEGPEYERYRAKLAEKEQKVEDFLEPKLAELAEKHPEIADDRGKLTRKLDGDDRRKLRRLRTAVDKFIADQGMEPPKALVLRDNGNIRPQRVFIRGNPSRRGDVAPARFLDLAGEGEPAKLDEGSGRLQMAREIADAENPLTARNIVNRVWMWHFGEGIVRTVDDFGHQGQEPDHPELLDWLARWFMDEGWSLKKLHRLILTSETWQQASSHPHTEENMLVDAENRLLWKFDEQRLELEQMRDGMLSVAGELSDEMFGRPVKILEKPFSDRRSVYAFIDRQNLDPIFRTFDFSNPQETTAQRPDTTIPMQALFTLNSDFVQNQAANLAEKTADSEDRVAALHRAVFARDPSLEDRQLAESFVTGFESKMRHFDERQTETTWSYGWGSVDEKSGEVTFTPFPHWTGDRWQITSEFPLKESPLSYLYAQNGRTHPGRTASESAIYQWRAPADLRIAVEGAIERGAVGKGKGKGNGVRVRIVTPAEGLIFDRVMDASRKSMPVRIPELTVKEGDRVHFVVEPHEDDSSHDGVTWAPRIVDLGDEWPTWDLAESFSGPANPATPWSAYAHALLNTNRFLFVR